jgi:hypothetical protein
MQQVWKQKNVVRVWDICSPCKERIYVELLLWHQHGEVQPAVADESGENDDIDRMDDMVANIGTGYDLESEDPLPEVQNF